MNALDAPPRLLGERLIADGHLSPDQLAIALQEQAVSRVALGKLLIRLGFIDEPRLATVLSAQAGVAPVDLETYPVSPDALACLPEILARRLHVLPLRHEPDEPRLEIAVAETRNLEIIDQLRKVLPETTRIELRLAGDYAIQRALDQHYGSPYRRQHAPEKIREGTTGPLAATAPSATDFIDLLLEEAWASSASDIHFEPEAGFLRIRFRIDGLLRQVRVLHAQHWPPLCVRLKVLAGLNIAESRAPQDGRFSLTLKGRSVDFRAASQPTLHGENIVLRLLDRDKGIVPLPRLGLSTTHLTTLHNLMQQPEGIILVTGPTGSGKTTTLYSLLDHLNSEQVNIMTLEDPVEYPLPRLRQTSLNEAVKLDFSAGIRSILRQDPDIILIGEIRDAETAGMAFRAALTGHQVFATLHSQSALGALPRLADLGLSPELVAGNLIGIIAQRLVRRLCPHCRVGHAPNELQKQLFASAGMATPEQLFTPGGCSQCDFQGYRGRLALLELLPIDATLEAKIVERTPLPALRQHLQASGWQSLADDGLARLAQGTTSLLELERILGPLGGRPQ